MDYKACDITRGGIVMRPLLFVLYAASYVIASGTILIWHDLNLMGESYKLSFEGFGSRNQVTGCGFKK